MANIAGARGTGPEKRDYRPLIVSGHFETKLFNPLTQVACVYCCLHEIDVYVSSKFMKLVQFRQAVCSAPGIGSSVIGGVPAWHGFQGSEEEL